ncbi:hypothetical protein [Draconibacterium sediminis]|uniref:Uncharacterized protein n=1 Tax=Draconibacterium sediminis TaxID=1544798 RepID=A0A0D8J8G8_9BACT|nr:hypothetical protein [Draconibacterium sediminis]KJF43094.1 hypothetical protein LH29_17090 [Draconibacterium sediminis]
MKTLENERELNPTAKKIHKINRLLDRGLIKKGKKVKEIAERYDKEKEDSFRINPTIEASLKATNYEKVSKNGSEYIKVCSVAFEKRHNRKRIHIYMPDEEKY